MNRARMAGIVCLTAGLLMLAACGGTSGGAWEEFLVQTDARHRAETEGAAPDFAAYVYPDALMGAYDARNPWYLDDGTGKSALTARRPGRMRKPASSFSATFMADMATSGEMRPFSQLWRRC